MGRLAQVENSQPVGVIDDGNATESRRKNFGYLPVTRRNLHAQGGDPDWSLSEEVDAVSGQPPGASRNDPEVLGECDQREFRIVPPVYAPSGVYLQ
jgi:hypothetical protein